MSTLPWYEFRAPRERLTMWLRMLLPEPYTVRFTPDGEDGSIDPRRRVISLNPRQESQHLKRWREVAPALRPWYGRLLGLTQEQYEWAAARAVAAHEAGHAWWTGDPQPDPVLHLLTNTLEDERVERGQVRRWPALAPFFTFWGDVTWANSSPPAAQGQAAILQACLLWRFEHDLPPSLSKITATLSGETAALWHSQIRPLAETAWGAATFDEVVQVAGDILDLIGEQREPDEEQLGHLEQRVDGGLREPRPQPPAPMDSPPETDEPDTDKDRGRAGDESRAGVGSGRGDDASEANVSEGGGDKIDSPETSPDVDDSGADGDKKVETESRPGPGEGEDQSDPHPGPNADESTERLPGESGDFQDDPGESPDAGAGDGDAHPDVDSPHASGHAATPDGDGGNSLLGGELLESPPTPDGEAECRVRAFPPRPFFDLEEAARPLATRLIGQLKAPQPRGGREYRQSGRRARARDVIRRPLTPFRTTTAPAITTPGLALQILGDRSGSMGSEDEPKMASARLGAMVLHLACAELHIPHAISLFDGQVMIKDFDHSDEMVKGHIAGWDGVTGAEHIDVLLAEREPVLLARPEPVKVVLVIHDGYPVAEGEDQRIREWIRHHEPAIFTVGLYLAADEMAADWMQAEIAMMSTLFRRLVVATPQSLPDQLGQLLVNLARGR